MPCTGTALLLTHYAVGPDREPSMQVVTPSVLFSISFHLFYFRCLRSTESVQTDGFFALSDQFLFKVDNSSIERVEEVKYLGTTLTNQNSIQ